MRNRPAQDNAAPSANAAAVMALGQLAALTGQQSYRQRAEAAFVALSGLLAKQYPSMTSLLLSKLTLDHSVSIIILAGAAGREGADFIALKRAAQEHRIFAKYVTCLHPDQRLPESHPAHGKTALDGAPTAYVCPGTTCLAPIQSAATLSATLDDLIKQRQNSLS